jgi:5-formyltetrahydrofolate cyclo-ligase
MEDVMLTKAHLRTRLSAERRIRPLSVTARPTGTVAAYLALASEPDPAPLLADASRLLLPRVLPDLSLELVAWEPGDELVRSRLGTMEPRGPAVPVDEADVVIVPALAVDPLTGIRLGRGGGSYDRLLAHVERDRRWAVLASEDELVEGLPAEAHDQPVARVVLPDRVLVIPP